MADRLTHQGVRDLDALGPRGEPGVRRAVPTNCVARGERHRWQPMGETRFEDGGGLDAHGWRYPDRVLDEYACRACGVTERRPR